MARFATLFATCGGIGYVPWAPGTFGSAAGLVLLYALRRSGAPGIEFLVLAIVVAVGIWSATVVERRLGRVDPGMVVVDEVAGMLLTMAFVPLTMDTALVGFVMFRVMDIVKPWPARRFERLPEGTGIMLDDLMAAVYANLATRAAIALGASWS